jgi:NodT family efflux transporter outer membrane factor (OMF) lipoprotein
MRRIAPALLLLAVAGCAIGPDYERPGIEAPPAFKEAEGWKVAEPRDAVPKGKWWEVFNDPVLNGLAEQVSVSNQSLKVAEARYAQARSGVASARSQFYPTLGGGVNASRSKGRSLNGSGSIGDSYTASLDASWEIDLWGRVRRLVEANTAAEAASAADVESARLSLQAELATNYFQLRVTDTGLVLLEDIVKAFQQSYDITQNRYKAGVVGKVDVVQAEAQLLSVRAQALDLRASRAALEHAIAVLVGKAPAGLTIEPAPFKARIPEIPAGLPATLLERRPDVAAAERRMAAANAQIGVAKAAYFPTLGLSASGGVASDSLTRLVNSSTTFWSLGVGLAGTILDFGARGAAVDSARANYDATVADYRDTVLQAFREVEDQLANVHYLGEASVVQEQATSAARLTVALTVNQYKAGTVSFINVATAQASQLGEERATVQLLGRRLAATVSLIRAIGGDWAPPRQ